MHVPNTWRCVLFQKYHFMSLIKLQLTAFGQAIQSLCECLTLPFNLSSTGSCYRKTLPPEEACQLIYPCTVANFYRLFVVKLNIFMLTPPTLTVDWPKFRVGQLHFKNSALQGLKIAYTYNFNGYGKWID